MTHPPGNDPVELDHAPGVHHNTQGERRFPPDRLPELFSEMRIRARARHHRIWRLALSMAPISWREPIEMITFFAAAPRLGGLFSRSDKASREMRLSSPWIALRGVVAIALGVTTFLFPLHALFTFTMLFAAFAFVDGATSLLAGIQHGRHRWALVLAGLVGIASAVLFAMMPLLMTVTYALITPLLLAGWAIATGALEIAAAVRRRLADTQDWLLGLSGALSVLLGFLMIAVLVHEPAATLLTTAWLIGAYAIATGIVLTVLGV
jgi:uncharacterized membrane protein HdeD (DUF308 family)